jgi:hypothetical protein
MDRCAAFTHHTVCIREYFKIPSFQMSLRNAIRFRPDIPLDRSGGL